MILEYHIQQQRAENFVLKEENSKLTKIVESLAKLIEDANSRNAQVFDELKSDNVKAHKEREVIRLDNVKTHQELADARVEIKEVNDNVENLESDLQHVRNTLDVVVEEIVPPSTRTHLYECFGLVRTNDPLHPYQYKTFCVQARTITPTIRRIRKSHPQCEVLLEIKPNPNSKNVLHRLKDQYCEQGCLKITKNNIQLLGDTTEQDLISYIHEVIDEKYDYMA